MRWKRAMASVCVYENTWPTCSEPLTVGGGVSIEKTSSRVFARSKVYVPSASHRDAHFSSSPSRLGFSGAAIRTSLGSGLDSLALDFRPDHRSQRDPDQDVHHQTEHARQ